MKSKQWLWAFAALPLVCVPLIAQENKDAPKSAAPAEPAQRAATAPVAGAAADAKAATEAEPVSTDKPDAPDERVSADNNTSFPVDI